MKFIQGSDRNQTHLFPVSLEHAIDEENEVRIIDLFVDSLKLADYGFKVDFIENGRPAYHPADLLKLYIYGYLNKTRSSRDLEKECKRNIEVMWLLKGLQPDHNTISNFRRDNPKAIKKVFRSTVQIAKHFDLIGGKLIAGDSTKLRAQNSKKNNYNQDKIDRHLAYIDNRIEEYSKVLAQQDGDNKTQIEQEINKQLTRKENYKQLEQQLNDTGEAQISTSDTESRQMITRNNITEVAYNVQTTVDAKHNLPIDYKVTNNNDSKAMGFMLIRAQGILGTTDFTALYDKGYHTGSEFKMAQELGINAIVAIPDTGSNAPDIRYNLARFQYNKEDDTYTCPEGHVLVTNGNCYSKNRGKHRDVIQIKQYKTKACKTCQSKELCTKYTRDRGRVIERSEFTEYIEQNRINVENNKTTYKRRQAIVEHPYGTIKRQWGYSYILTKKGKARASADVGFMFTAYNLRRIINILGADMFKKYLKVLVLCFLKIFALLGLNKLNFKRGIFYNKYLSYNYKLSLECFIFEPNLKRGGGF
jgi:transposase